MQFSEGHEGTGEAVTYIDEDFDDFLRKFDEKGYLKNTTVLLLSDHGNHMHYVYQLTTPQQYIHERSLPMMYIALPKNIDQKYMKQIKENEQKLVYARDIHYFF
mmetsp:Transcript_22521/g.19498  ORF Transcript_22521/g.19498 Transcript_22521/m.19498 type:complete len:104 (+) Transcript_22521:778-1089(+)